MRIIIQRPHTARPSGSACKSACARLAARLCALILLLSPCMAEAKKKTLEEEDKGTLSLVYENDVFYNTDQHYTNGVRISWLSGLDHVPGFLLWAAEASHLFPKGGNVRVEYALGQNMYTPTDITLADPPEDDRPYAGWLYGSLGLISENGSRLHQLELQIGVVGPSSRAEETQTFVHKYITDSDEPQGWDTQLPNETTYQLYYLRSWRALAAVGGKGFGADLTPQFGLAAGTVYDYLEGGLMLRLGRNLELDYGPPRIQPSPPGSGYFKSSSSLGFYLFGGAMGRAVAYNMFLDGTMFHESRSVDKEYFVADLISGAALTWRDFRLAYTHVFRTPEFEGETDFQQYGSLTLSMKF